ncbi:macrophage mannose receptor 1-like [Gigantopelta aegis]|uniref:macrophage mannose receptor 1-like n=1 Tax=Gigantopelta aegis TaxID=1735272 RepID=UPI001B88B292|nr:macrophage mannose receptor 1-like [Gigantopelta aegis]
MKSVDPILILLMSVFLHASGSVRSCTNLDNFSFLRRNREIRAVGIDEIDNIGIVQCAAECKLRDKCKSSSFQHSSGKCKLFGITIQQAWNLVVNQIGTDLSDKQDWPSIIAGPCEDHTCSSNEVCVPKSRYSKNCVTAYCPSPLPIDNAQADFNISYETTKVGSQLSYTCDFTFHPVGNRTGLPDGTWSDFRCEPNRCPTENGYVLLNNPKMCFKSSSVPNTIDNARASCYQSGARLIVLDTDDKNEAVANALVPGNYFIGLTDSRTEGVFVWDDERVASFTKWKPGEPNDMGGDEDCVLLQTIFKKWIDFPCTVAMEYICEKPV